jgi:N-acetylmuramic acid 6-phosphate etherase
MGLDDLITEARSAETRDLDLRSTEELVGLMNEQDAAVPAAVASSAADIAAVIDTVVERLQAGGRLVYVGAGSSGRLAAVDASECESTFSAAPGQVAALLAGADAPSAVEQEAAEDDAEAGRRDVHSLGVGATDAVIGISASGRTPYVLGAIEAAVAAGAATACIVSVPGS